MEFLTFPPEIRLLIISHVSSISDLASLSQSCRLLHHLCDMSTRKRFHQIRVVSSDDDSINKTFDLLMQILKEPKLGNYVKELVQAKKPTFKRPYVETQEQRNLDADDRSLLRGAVQNAGFTGPQENSVFNMLMQNDTNLLDEEFWSGHLILDFLDRPTRLRCTYIAQALAAMIISVSPNLESLAISQPFSDCLGLGTTRGRHQPENIPDAYFPLDRLLRRLNVDPTTTPYLQNLRKVYMIVSDGDSDGRYYEEIDFFECTTFFDSLPSIESISTDALYLGDEVRRKLEPGSSKISKIHLNHSALQMPELVSVVQACKELREFQYSIGGRIVEEGWFASFNAKIFIKSICPHKDTLEILDIDAERNMLQLQSFNFDEDRVDQQFDDDLMGRAAHLLNHDDDEHQLALSLQGNIGSLRDFHALKRLSLGIGFLIYFAMGVRKDGDTGPREPLILPESLPRGLEYLCIRGYRKGICKVWDEHIDVLVRAFESGSLGTLKEIKGIEKIIPHAKDVEDLFVDTDKLWTPFYDV